MGTAIPIKPIGPQNAVTLPARILVHANITTLENLTFSPILAA